MLNLLQDQRVSVDVSGDMLEWELVIDDVTEEDAGQYECQVNTNPLSQLKVVLRVTSTLCTHFCRIFRTHTRRSRAVYAQEKFSECDMFDSHCRYSSRSLLEASGEGKNFS